MQFKLVGIYPGHSRICLLSPRHHTCESVGVCKHFRVEGHNKYEAWKSLTTDYAVSM